MCSKPLCMMLRGAWRAADVVVHLCVGGLQVAMQIVALCSEIFREERLDLWLRPYSIICVGDQAGE
jgi:hypothetical protein